MQSTQLHLHFFHCSPVVTQNIDPHSWSFIHLSMHRIFLYILLCPFFKYKHIYKNMYLCFGIDYSVDDDVINFFGLSHIASYFQSQFLHHDWKQMLLPSEK